MKTRKLALVAAAAWLAAGLTAASAQPAKPQAPKAAAAAPADLTVLPPVSHDYKAKRTSWGDPDLRGVWPIDSLGGLPLQRSADQGDRVFLTDEEFAKREAAMARSREAADKEDKAGKLGMGHWVEMTGAGRRTSLLTDPKNGRLPELTEYGKKMNAVGRSSWIRDQTYDWVTDFDSWDRCITRGFPASMLPFRYNNGIQILQAPGYVVVSLEMIHDARIIPLDGRALPDKKVVNWMGVSRGHWEGDTLVVETSHIKSGASPLNMATIGAPFGNTIPMSDQAHVTERFTLTGANTLAYEMTFSDPVVWKGPFSVRMDIPRNDGYGMYEYACHEGDEQVRNYIVASRAQRAKDAQKQAEAPAAQQQAQAEPQQPQPQKK